MSSKFVHWGSFRNGSALCSVGNKRTAKANTWTKCWLTSLSHYGANRPLWVEGCMCHVVYGQDPEHLCEHSLLVTKVTEFCFALTNGNSRAFIISYVSKVLTIWQISGIDLHPMPIYKAVRVYSTSKWRALSWFSTNKASTYTIKYTHGFVLLGFVAVILTGGLLLSWVNKSHLSKDMVDQVPTQLILNVITCPCWD